LELCWLCQYHIINQAFGREGWVLVCTSLPIDFIIAGKVISELSHCKLQFVMKRR